jgi:hypothetical protein
MVDLDKVEADAKAKLKIAANIKLLEAAAELLPRVKRVNLLLVGDDETQVQLAEDDLEIAEALKESLPEVLEDLITKHKLKLGDLLDQVEADLNQEAVIAASEPGNEISAGSVSEAKTETSKGSDAPNVEAAAAADAESATDDDEKIVII